MDRETQPSQTCIGTEKRLPEISLLNGFDPERTPFDELMCYQYDSSSALSFVSFLLFAESNILQLAALLSKPAIMVLRLVKIAGKPQHRWTMFDAL